VVRVGAARVLLEHGVDANARDANNATPLHLVTGLRYWESGCLDVARLLLQYGSDIHARDDKGQTPFMKLCGSCWSTERRITGCDDVMTTDEQGTSWRLRTIGIGLILQKEVASGLNHMLLDVVHSAKR